MPNAEGRAATKRTPAKKTTPAAAPAAAEESRTERHVKSPLERAQAVYDKAKTVSDKIATRLTAAEADVAKLREEAREAKVTLDWAASHPLLVKARAEAEDAETPARDNTVEWDIDANRPMSETVAADEAGVDSTTDAGGDEAAGEPAAPTDVFEQGEPDEEEATAPATASFPFDAPPAAPAPSDAPFNFDAPTGAPSGNVTRV